ncbi:MAG: histidine phosphatase family protein [Clostridia bacterium]|nr:histidine phosphatase family protein [Clostridia bacterium]
MILFYLRHGDPIYDPDSLTPLGKRQAEALGRRLSIMGVDEIYASSSNRAKMTAQPTCELLRKEMQILDWANEKYAWEELTVPLDEQRKTWVFHHPDYLPILSSPEVRALGRRWYEHPAFDAERMGADIRRVQRETDNWLSGFGYQHDLEKNMYWSSGEQSKRVALFAHQGFSTVFLSSVLDIPYCDYCTRFDMQHSGMTVIHFPEKEGWVIPKVLQLSNDSHLYKESLPTLYNYQIRI